MAVLTVQTISRAGLNASFAAAAAGGDSFVNDGKTYLHAKNGSGGALTVTIASQVANPPAGLAPANVAVSVPAAGERIIGPAPQAAFNDVNGRCVVTYSGVTSLTVAAVALPAL